MIFVSILLFVMIVGYLYFTWNHNYWKKLKIPYDKPSLLFGSVKEVLSGKKHFGILYKELYDAFQNVPYFGYYKIRSPGLILRDPDLIKDVLIKDFASFSCYDFKVDPEVDPIWSHTVFSQHGNTWKKNRAAWCMAFTPNKLKGMHEEIDSKCQNMIRYVKNKSKTNPAEAFEARELIFKFNLDVILSTMMGIDYDSFNAEENPYANIIRSASLSTIWDGLKMLSFMFFPGLAKILNIRFVPQDVEKNMLELTKTILQNHQTETNHEKYNVIDSILESDAYKEFSEIQAAAILYTFLFEGTETSSGILAYMLYELSNNLDVQNKLRTEIESVFNTDNENVSFDKIQDLKYLDMVIFETLRLYPPSLLLQRLCTKPYCLPVTNENQEPIILPAGTPVIIPVYGLHMDSKYFPDPEKFDPERFSDENKGNIHKCTYLPFGEGPRICIGFRLALHMAKIGIIHILKNFEVRLTPKMDGIKLEIDPNTYILKTIDGLWIKFHERLNEI